MKFVGVEVAFALVASRPARGAWIEIENSAGNVPCRGLSRPARGAWIEIGIVMPISARMVSSHPARGAWIEMSHVRRFGIPCPVAPRKGRVD